MKEKLKYEKIKKLISVKKKTIILSAFMIASFFAALITSKTLYSDTEKIVLHQITSVTSKTAVTTNTTANTTTTQKSTSTTTSATKTNKTKSSAVFPIDINLVTYDELLQIYGVGDVIANNILDFRNAVGVITNMDLLLQVKGIGDKKLQILKQYLYVSEIDYQEITITATVTPETTTVETESKTNNSSNNVETTTTTKSVMKQVNINTATAEEISECLLLDDDIACRIVQLRTDIQYFSNSLELLYVEGITIELYNKIKDYILV